MKLLCACKQQNRESNMQMMLSFVCLVLLAMNTKVSGEEDDCPLWTSLNNNSVCKCGDVSTNLVQCEDKIGASTVLKCFCMTTVTTSNGSIPVVGPCLQTCGTARSQYLKLPTNTSTDLNNKTCGPFHRTGVLCSKCIEGYGLPVYSYNLSCVNYTDYKYNWIKYVAVAYGPLTLFYIAAVIFRISATSGLMTCYVTICQMPTIRVIVLLILKVNFKGQAAIAITLLCIWNLDFFRSLYTPFCVHPTISALHVLLLDYLGP